MNRAENLRRLREAPLDVLILGGGINGAGLARDLALRSPALRIGLVEKAHFGSGTSGKNSHLIHGGLRYLKSLDLGLVREALRERATLLRVAPHRVRPLRFLIPMYGAFARLYYTAGLWLYDALAGADNLEPHRTLARDQVAGLEPDLARDRLAGGAAFSDCFVESARLVLDNVADAARRGAIAVNYAQARVEAGVARLTDRMTGESFDVRARKFVDATGPWMSGGVRLVRGSHIVIPRVNRSDHAIAHFESSGRIVFVIPWGTERRFSLVGTTDFDHAGSPDEVHISDEEIRYLTGAVRRLFPAADAEPISTFSSLRALVPDGSADPRRVGRGHRIWNDDHGVLHIAGGKYTTYRAMAEEAADHVLREIAPDLADVHLTATTPLPPEPAGDPLVRAVETEMAQHLQDVLSVSTTWAYERRWTSETLRPLAERMGALLGWDDDRIRRESAIE
ncbi:MAG: glycerol-3-phosphate dehydrogenase/oxidase [Bryobacteraceae bacterium]